MFVQYSFVRRRDREMMGSEPAQLSENAIIAIGAGFMIAVSLIYIAVHGFA